MKTLIAAFVALMMSSAMATEYGCIYVLKSGFGRQEPGFMAVFKRYTNYTQQVACNMAKNACEYSRQNVFNGQGQCEFVNQQVPNFSYNNEQPVGGCFTAIYQSQNSVFPDKAVTFAHATTCGQSYQNCAQSLQSGQHCVVFGNAPQRY